MRRIIADRSDGPPARVVARAGLAEGHLRGLTSRDVQLELVDPYSPRAAHIWNELACSSYFLTWGWVENWLACLPADRAPRLAVLRDGDHAVAACFLAQRLVLRRRVIASRAIYVNTTGVPRLDDLWIEYNGLVGEELPLATLVDALPGRWDECFLPGLRETAFGGIAETTNARYRVLLERRVPAYYVDLEAARAKGYLAMLSGQTRSQIRKAQRLVGAIALEVAADESQAFAIYDELTALHAAQWRAKGQPGAFADPWFDKFHRRLIAKRFASGEIQLVRVRTEAGTLGCLYNFVWSGRVLQYQSGLATFDDGRIKPGFIVHTATIEHCAAAQLAVYDLLGGDMRYKKSLSTGAGWLLWCKVQRRRLRFALEDRLVKLMRDRRANVAAPEEPSEP
jgi:hypothetical protein